MRFDENYKFEKSNSLIKFNIIFPDGDIYILNLNQETTIESILKLAVTTFLKNSLTENSIFYKLISSNQKKVLCETKTLKDERIIDGENLILKKRNSSSTYFTDLCDKTYFRVTEQQIAEATKSIPFRNNNHRLPSISNYSNFYNDIRKILVTLIDYSEKLLRDHPKIKYIFNNSNEEIFDLKNFDVQCEQEIDEHALKQLKEMGFPLDKSKKALRLNKMNPIEAMDWLLAYQAFSSNSRPNSSGKSLLFLQEYNTNNSNDNDSEFNCLKLYNNVPKLVQSYRKFKRNNFQYNKIIFDNMKKIGFVEEEIIDSLWVNNNNQNSACEWLLSDKRPKPTDLNKGLLRGSILYNSLLENPVIQLGLLKPKVFFAFFFLIEEPNATSKWLSDPEISPILSQIFKIYHSEKYSICEQNSININSID